jgi:hypothetical protein
MAYTPDMKQSANRHYVDGKKLFDANCFDNAGYHFGFSAECGAKFRLLNAKVREDDDAIWSHFPSLVKLSLIAIEGRSDADLYSVLSKAGFMQEWNTNMRYSKNGSISKVRAEKWRKDADEILGLLV